MYIKFGEHGPWDDVEVTLTPFRLDSPVDTGHFETEGSVLCRLFHGFGDFIMMWMNKTGDPLMNN